MQRPRAVVYPTADVSGSSPYLQLVNLAITKIYDSTQFFRSRRVQTRKAYSGYLGTQNEEGHNVDEMLRGGENKHRSEIQNRETFRTTAESMGRQETTWRTETT
ncbi:hypothetical protein HAX54_003186 [Datura stramonium]|uniref:Uncharacterized protein n=1 Tax=Datura stramonium TaxID=4076 RepID=A0ABS8T609_DATST|nr:hypothetical protein [Datura stramonium]